MSETESTDSQSNVEELFPKGRGGYYYLPETGPDDKPGSRANPIQLPLGFRVKNAQIFDIIGATDLHLYFRENDVLLNLDGANKTFEIQSRKPDKELAPADINFWTNLAQEKGYTKAEPPAPAA